MTTKVNEYKGKEVLGIYNEGSDFPVVSFGLRKAQAIIQNIEAIQSFVNERKVE